MSDDKHDEPRSDEGPSGDPDPAARDGSVSDDESGTEIPISTGDGENGNDSTNDRTDSAGDADEDAASDEGVEIAVETGSPGPDIDRRSAGVRSGEETGIDLGSSGTGLFDRLNESVLTLLSRVLDTETHLRVYVALRRRPWSAAEAIAAETGLYPRTVRDALDALEARSAITRRGPPGETNATGDKGDEGNDDRGEDSGYDPEYAAVAPSALLMDAVGGAERGLPEGLDLDRYLGSEPTTDPGDPVRIDVEDDSERTDADEPDGSKAGADDADERDADEEHGSDEAGEDGETDGNDGTETN